MKKILYLALCAAVLFGLYRWYTAYHVVVRDDTVLRVGTSHDYPPYTFKQGNQIVGFDIELIEAVAHCMGKKVEIVGMPFSALIFALFAQDVDVLASAMSPTPRRAKFVSFSDAYLSGDPLVIMSYNGHAYSIDDLKDKRVVVNTGFVADTYMSGQKTKELVRLKTPAEAVLALQTGSVDAWVTAKSSAHAFLKKIKNADHFSMQVIPGTFDDYAFVVNPNNKNLADALNEALRQVIGNGIVDELKMKWNIV